MKQCTLLCTIMMLSFMACQKDNSNANNTNVLVDNYLPLKVGNYWIYNSSTVSDVGIEILDAQLDSVYIPKDTLINGQTYYKLVSSANKLFVTKFIKDSLHYIVDNKGVKLFSSENFADTLQIIDNRGIENIVKIQFYKMEREDNVQSPIGTYNCLDYRLKAILTNPVKGDNSRYCHNYYAKDIGIVKKTGSYLSSNMYIKEALIRYKVQ